MIRQVPKKYTIIGGGRVARHMAHYFDLHKISYESWSRDNDSSVNTYSIKDAALRLQCALNQADMVLLLIKDDAIPELIQQYPFLREKFLLHFSGALKVEGVVGCHPLMTFGDQLYALETYHNIPFVVDEGHEFRYLFPALPNPSVNLSVESKAYYHSLCVMAGNFAQTLWREVGMQFEQVLGIDQAFLFPYLKQNMLNFAADPANSATGPIARGDVNTIQKHLDVLKDNQLEAIYKSFLNYSKHQDAMQQTAREEVMYEYS
ncbi:DUF2520 domain-containing protein [Marinicella sp. W31]|uniref:DUF2520 domain-containing protein n=1 Tax=Marinicella sp. W31 TaxID=3023713 RepID=UPI003756B74F